MKISSAYIEITSECNLSCIACYNRSGKTCNRKELSFEQIKFIIHKLVYELNCTSICFSGGEPTLHPQFKRILDYVLSFPNLQIGITTNGTIQMDFLFSAYNNYPNLKVQVSLDGSNEDINSKVRGRGNFSKTMSFINKLSSFRREVTVKMVISRLNMYDVEPYYRKIASLYCKPDFAFINNMGRAMEIWDNLKLTPKEKLSVINKIEKLNSEYLINVPLPMCTYTCPLGNPSHNLSILIKCNGSIQPCQMLYDDNFTIGNILEDSSSDIAEKYECLYKYLHSLKQDRYICANCLANKICNGGCIASSEFYIDKLITNKSDCNLRVLQILNKGL